MAGAGYKLFNTGDVLTAAQVNTYLNEQTVMVFASSAARTSALSGVLAEGMVSYLQDTNAVEVYNGTAWVGVSGAGDVTEVQAGTGISVASGTGPIPVVTNTMATAIDAEGDLIIGDAADAFQRLAIGSNTHVLTVDTSVDGKIKWAAPAGASMKGCSLYRGSGQTIADNTATILTFDNEYFDTDGFHDNSTNNSRITIPAGLGGKYLITGLCYVEGINATGTRILRIFKNGTAGTRLVNNHGIATSNAMYVQSQIVVSLAATDYVELQVLQTSGGNQIWYPTNDGFGHFTAVYLGA